MKTKKLIVVLVLVLVLAITSLATACNTSYNVTVENGTGGGTITAGSECTVTATIPDGQQFVEWVDGEGKEVSTKNPYTFTVTADVTIKAQFENVEPDKFNVTISDIDNGTVESDYAKTVAGTEIELTVKADVGYELSEIKFNNTVIEQTDGAFTFTMPAENVTITATFVLIEFDVTVASEIANGTVTVDKSTANMGSVVTITVTPDVGYNLADNSLKANGVAVPMVNGKYTVVVATADVTITAEFEQSNFTIRVSGGVIGEDATSGEYAYGEVITITAPAITGCDFIGWFDITDSENVVSVGSTMQCEYTVTKSANLQAQYDDIAYTVEVTNGEADETSYLFGDKCTITANVPAGKEFAYWVINGDDEKRETDDPYTFIVSSNMTFVAVFKDDVPEVGSEMFTVESGGNYCDGSYFEGEDVTVELSTTLAGNAFGVNAYQHYGWVDQDGNEYIGTSFVYENITKDLVFTPIYKFVANANYFAVADNFATITLDRFLNGENAESPFGSIFTLEGNDKFESVNSIIVTVYTDVEGSAVATFKITYVNNSYLLMAVNDDATSLVNGAGNELGNGYLQLTPSGDATMLQDSFLFFLQSIVANFDINTTYYFGSQIEVKTNDDIVSSDIAIGNVGLNVAQALSTNNSVMVNVTNSEGSAIYTVGSEVTVTYSLPSDKDFTGWVNGEGDVVSTKLSYTFTANKNVELTATEIERVAYGLTIDSAIANGTVTIEGNLTEAYCGDVITIVVTADNRFALVANSLTVNGVVVNAVEGVYTYTVGLQELTITAQFEQIIFGITVDSNLANGTITIENDAIEAEIGDEIVITVTANAGYMYVIGTFSINGDLLVLNLDGTYRYTMTGEEIVITAEFAEIPDTLFTVVVSENTVDGTVTANVNEALYGTEITLTVTPNAGYALQAGSLKVNGIVLTANSDGEYVFNMPAENVTITATFIEAYYDVTVEGGTMTGGVTTVNVKEGSTVTVILTDRTTLSKEGELLLTFEGWYNNGVLESTDAQYTFTVKGNVELEAQYKFIASTGLAFVEKSGYLDLDRLGSTINPDKSANFGQLNESGNAIANAPGYSILDNADVDHVKIYFYAQNKDGSRSETPVVTAKYTMVEGIAVPVLVYTANDGSEIIVKSTAEWGANKKGFAGFNVMENWGKAWGYTQEMKDAERMSVWFESILGDAYDINDNQRFYVGSQIIAKQGSGVQNGDIAVYETYSFVCAQPK